MRELSNHEKNCEVHRPSAELAWPGTPVLCIAGRGEHDGAAAAMLAQLLDRARHRLAHFADIRNLPGRDRGARVSLAWRLLLSPT